MTDLWWKTDQYEVDTPCTHALVIGTSYYSNLPLRNDDTVPDDGRVTLGLGQATTPATSALLFAQWLREEYNNTDTPLGSIRLLLSPSEEEQQIHGTLANPDPTIQTTTRANVKSAIRSWKRDCEKNRDHVAILYVAGHGVQLSKDDSIVLLEDFADPNENILHCAIDIGSIWRGMRNERAALTQFYFVDACRIKPSTFQQYANAPVGVTLDEEEHGTVKAAPIFFSAAARSYALGEPGKGTLFLQALLDCLSLYAVEAPDQDGRWSVTTSSLLKRLPPQVSALARSFGEEQTTVPGGLPVDVIFHVLPGPPNIPLTVDLNPEKAADYALAKIWQRRGREEKILFENAKFEPRLERDIPGGKYILAVSFPDDVQQYQGTNAEAVIAFPPRCSMEVLV